MKSIKWREFWREWKPAAAAQEKIKFLFPLFLSLFGLRETPANHFCLSHKKWCRIHKVGSADNVIPVQRGGDLEEETLLYSKHYPKAGKANYTYPGATYALGSSSQPVSPRVREGGGRTS